MEKLIEQGKRIASGKRSKNKKNEAPSINPIFSYLNKNYNINALSLKCNSDKCKKKPENKVIISESGRKSRELAMIYLCDKHSENLDSFQKELNDISNQEIDIGIEN